MLFLSKFIEPTECHKVKRFVFANDLVLYKGNQCVVITGLKRDVTGIPVDYCIEVRPVFSTVDIGGGAGVTVLIQSNDVDLITSGGGQFCLDQQQNTQ